MSPQSTTTRTIAPRPRLSISLAKVGVVAAIDEILLVLSSAKDLLDGLRKQERRVALRIVNGSDSDQSSTSSPTSPTSPAFTGAGGGIVSQAGRLAQTLKDTRVIIRSYYDAYNRLLGQQYAHGDYIALDELKTVVNYIQEHIIQHLSSSLEACRIVDYRDIHHALTCVKNTTIDALVQLHQRLAPASAPRSPTSSDESLNNVSRVTSIDTIIHDIVSEENIHPAFRRGWQSTAPDSSSISAPPTSWRVPISPTDDIDPTRPSWLKASGGRVRNVLRRTTPFRSASFMSQEAVPDIATPISPISDNDTCNLWPTISQTLNCPPSPVSPIDSNRTIISPRLHRQSTAKQPTWWQAHARTVSSASEESQVSSTFTHTSAVESDRTSITSMRSVISIPLIPKRSPLRVVNDTASKALKRVSIFSIQDVLPLSVGHSRNVSASSSNQSCGDHAGELPRDTNGYRGLCKSAYLLQCSADMTRSLREVKNRDSIIGFSGNVSSHRWVCKTPGCHFDGPVAKDSDGRTVLDRTVMSKSSRVMFRWSFLFKSHLPQLHEDDVGRVKWYACVFCHADVECEGNAAYLGEEALMEHIEEAHVGEGRWPEGQVLTRMGAVVGRPGEVGVDWDIWLPNHYIGTASRNSWSSLGSVGEERRMSVGVRRKPLPLSVVVP